MTDECLYVVYGSRETKNKVYGFYPTFESAWISVPNAFFQDKCARVAIQRIALPSMINVKAKGVDTRILVNSTPEKPVIGAYSLPEYINVSIDGPVYENGDRVSSYVFYDPFGCIPRRDVYVLYEPDSRNVFGDPIPTQVGYLDDIKDYETLCIDVVNSCILHLRVTGEIFAEPEYNSSDYDTGMKRSVTYPNIHLPASKKKKTYHVSCYIRVMRWASDGKLARDDVVSMCTKDAASFSFV